MITNTNDNPNGIPVSVPEFAKFIGSIPGQIQHYIQEGMPIFRKGGKGNPHVLSSADCYGWLIDRAKRMKYGVGKQDNGEDNSRNRATNARAEAIEFDLDLKRGKYIPIDDVLPIFADQMIEARGILQNIAPKAKELLGPEAAKFFEGELAAAFELIKIAKRPMTLKEVEEYRNGR